MKGILDKLQEKLVSRKLLVFITGTLGLYLGDLESRDWVIIATAYIAIQGVTDIVSKLKS